jgi:hypothetical protein
LPNAGCREDPTLIEVVFEDTVPVLNYTRNASLWDVGNRFNARVMNSECCAVLSIPEAERVV